MLMLDLPKAGCVDSKFLCRSFYYVLITSLLSGDLSMRCFNSSSVVLVEIVFKSLISKRRQWQI